MKIIAISDLHGNKPDIPDGDMLIVAGDSLYYGSPRELDDFDWWLKKLPHKHKIVIAGNHDRILEKKEMEKRLEFCTYLKDNSLEIEGIKIYGSPWTPMFNNWAFMLEPDEIRKKWMMIPDDTDILVTHGPPYGILDRTNYGQHVGCHSLLPRVLKVKPRYHIFGHIHPAHGVQEERGITFVNAAICDDALIVRNKPVVLEYETKKG